MKQSRLFTLLGLVSLVFWIELAGYRMDSDPPVQGLVVRLSILFLLWASAGLLLRRHEISLRTIVGFGLVFRAVAWFMPPFLENDFFRYLWEGKVLRAGFSPYRFAPDSLQLAHLRDEIIWPWIGYPDVPAAYPPLALALFALISPLGIKGLKALFLSADLLVLILLEKLLPAEEKRWLLLYAWCPLAIRESVSTLHYDIVVVALVCGAILLLRKQHFKWSIITYTLACGLKFYPLFLAPAIFKRRFPLAWLWAGVLLFTSYVPFLATEGLEALTGLRTYAGEWEFNSSIFSSIMNQSNRSLASMVNLGSTILMTFLALRMETTRGCIAVLLVLLLTGPVLDPWYVLWLLPFLCLQREPSGLTLVGLVSISYLYFETEEMLPEIFFSQFIPIYAVVLYRLATSARSRSRS